VVHFLSSLLIAELDLLRASFYQCDYAGVAAQSVENFTRSDDAQLYQYRARILLGEAAKVLQEMENAGTTGAGFEAVKAYAKYCTGKKDEATKEIAELTQDYGDEHTVQVIAAIVYFTEGRVTQAVDLLLSHENNIEASVNIWDGLIVELPYLFSFTCCSITLMLRKSNWWRQRAGGRITY
jgi:Coatomer epsilon subunit